MPATTSNHRLPDTRHREAWKLVPRRAGYPSPQIPKPDQSSCSTAGTVSFSLGLLTQPLAFREYVIVHELRHLKVPKHGRLCKSLLRVNHPAPDTRRPFRRQHPPLKSPPCH